MAEVKWIKIVTDIFDDEKILLIERLPESDTILVIWFKLLCLAGKQNNSGVFIFKDKIPYTDEMLSTIFRRDIVTVRLALQTFEEFGMIEIINGVITIANWEKHQTLDQLELAKEQTRKRVARHREKKKQMLLDNNVTECNVTVTLPVTQCNGNRIDKDIDKDIDKEIYIHIVDYLNKKINSKYKPTSQATKRHITARLNDGFTFDDFKTVIDKKYDEWYGTDMQQYLRPETLFGTKFESYLNAPVKKGVKDGNTKKPNGSEYAEFF